jgi:chromate transport protein ChrA
MHILELSLSLSCRALLYTHSPPFSQSARSLLITILIVSIGLVIKLLFYFQMNSTIRKAWIDNSISNGAFAALFFFFFLITEVVPLTLLLLNFVFYYHFKIHHSTSRLVGVCGGCCIFRSFFSPCMSCLLRF